MRQKKQRNRVSGNVSHVSSEDPKPTTASVSGQEGNVTYQGSVNTQGDVEGRVGYEADVGDTGATYGGSVGTGNPEAHVGYGGESGHVTYGGTVGSDTEGNVGVGANVGYQNGRDSYSVGAQSTGTVGANYTHQTGEGSYSVGAGSGGATGSVTIGEGESNQTGAQIGGAVGAVVGSAIMPGAGTFIGGVAGSAIGSAVGAQFRALAHEERKNRNRVSGAYTEAGIFDPDGTAVMADGTKFDFHVQDSQETHAWKDESRAGKEAGRPLFNYETDFTNDLDYTAGMAGITLSRLLGGRTSKEIDQIGAQMGNAFLGKSGYGAQMDQNTFSNTMTNARAQYARSGIKSKEEMLAIANKAYADGRLEDADYAVAQQTAEMVFDNNFNTAQQLMAGRWKGIETASKTPSGSGDITSGGKAVPKSSSSDMPPGWVRPPNAPNGPAHPRALTAEEALMSVQPYYDYYRARYGSGSAAAQRLRSQQNMGNTIQLISGIVGAYGAVNRASNGRVGSYIGNWLQSLLGSGGAKPTAESSGGTPSSEATGGWVQNENQNQSVDPGYSAWDGTYETVDTGANASAAEGNTAPAYDQSTAGGWEEGALSGSQYD